MNEYWIVTNNQTGKIICNCEYEYDSDDEYDSEDNASYDD